MRTTLAISIAVGLLSAAAGCSDDTMAQDRITIPDPPYDRVVDGAWQSSAWFSTMTAPEPWIALPAMSTVRVHHTLGRTPVSVELYVAPDEPDTNPDGEFGAGAAPAAGDLAQIVDVNTMYVEIHNRLETPHFLRIVLR